MPAQATGLEEETGCYKRMGAPVGEGALAVRPIHEYLAEVGR